MNDAMEDRLRAYFADRTAHEPLPGGAADTLLDDLRAGRAGRRSRWPGAALVAAAVAIAVLAAGQAIANDDDSGLDMVDTPFTPEAPDPTTVTEPAPVVEAGRSVVVSIDGVLGWWDGSQWVQAQTGFPAPAEGGERYKVVGIGYPPREAIGTAPIPKDESSCQPDLQIDVGLEEPDIGAHPPIAVTGVDRPVPRPVEELDPSSDAYREIAIDVLASSGIDDTDPEIVLLLRTDLEGDGTDEVFMVIERVTGPYGMSAVEGDYSVAAVRKVVDGRPVSSLLGGSFAGPGEDGVMDFSPIRLSAVADLNGDGQMEVVLYLDYAEGDSFTSVFTVDRSGAVQEVLWAGWQFCGTGTP